MDIKLVAIDLDGTLLDSHKEVSKKNLDIINELRKKGVYIVISTGRPAAGFSWILDSLDPFSDDEYSVSNTGTLIIKNKDRSDLWKKDLSMKDYLKVKDLITDDMQIGIYNKNVLLNNNDVINKHFLFEADILKMPIEKFDESNMDTDVDRITMAADSHVMDEFVEKYDHIFKKDYQTVRNVPEVYEILNKEADKSKALSHLLDKLSIKSEEMLAIGDSHNDKTMLTLAGIGATCSNGRKSVKDMCDIVSDYSNDEDGVYHILKEVFYNN